MKKNVIITNEMYINFIKNAIETEGWKVADTANKMALESSEITQAQYSVAAQMVVKAFLNSCEE